MTPQGDVRITGLALATETVSGLGQTIAVLLLFTAGAYLLRVGSRGRLNWWIGRTGSTWLIVIGVLALLCLPVVGTIALVGGVMAKVNRYAARRAEIGSPFGASE